jgi:DNA-binding NarL/FixJ family response regulator
MSFTADPAGGAVVQFRRAGAALASRPPLLRIDPAQLSERLTPRERDVLARLADGLDNRTIAKDLGVEYSTVRGHVRSLIEKFGARSRVDVVAIAYRTGLVRRTEAER